jgi:hypothetical protein
VHLNLYRPKTIKFRWPGKSTLFFAFESHPIAPRMEDVTYLPRSTANAYNEIIRKVDTIFLATSPGSSTLSTLDNSNCNRTIVVEILQNISQFRQNISFIITPIKHYVQCSASRSDSSEPNTKSYERAITGSWIGFFQSTNPEDIVDTLCDIMPYVSDSKDLFCFSI